MLVKEGIATSNQNSRYGNRRKAAMSQEKDQPLPKAATKPHGKIHPPIKALMPHPINRLTILIASKAEYLNNNAQSQRFKKERFTALKKARLALHSERFNQLEARYLRTKSKQILNKTQEKIGQDSEYIGRSRKAYNDHTQKQKAAQDSTCTKQSSHLNRRRAHSPRTDRLAWSEQNELILILLLSLESFNETTVSALLPFEMEACQHHLKCHLYRLYNNLTHKVIQYSRSPLYRHRIQNPILVDLLQQFVKSNPQQVLPKDLKLEPDLIQTPILSTLQWKKIKQ